MLTIGVILNIVCYQWRGVSSALFYHECLLILIETVALGRDDIGTILMISVRFILAEILLSCEAKRSIVCVTACCSLTHASMHLVLTHADIKS